MPDGMGELEASQVHFYEQIVTKKLNWEVSWVFHLDLMQKKRPASSSWMQVSNPSFLLVLPFQNQL